jgi:nucleoside-diphosphate kinase
MMHLSRDEAEGFYAVHRERPFFKDLVRFHDLRPGAWCRCCEGENAIRRTAT